MRRRALTNVNLRSIQHKKLFIPGYAYRSFAGLLLLSQVLLDSLCSQENYLGVNKRLLILGARVAC